MPAAGHNNPPVILELTPEQARFLHDEAANAMGLGLALLTAPGGRESAEKIVAAIEAWRPIRDKLKGEIGA